MNFPSYAQIMVLGWAIMGPIVVWKLLGDADFCAGLDPRLQKVYGVKLYVGKNGRNYVDPPPPLKRLQVSLVLGLLTATLLGSAVAFVWHFLPQ